RIRRRLLRRLLPRNRARQRRHPDPPVRAASHQHLLEPRRILRDSRRLLRPEATLHLEPLRDSNADRLLGHFEESLLTLGDCQPQNIRNGPKLRKRLIIVAISPRSVVRSGFHGKHHLRKLRIRVGVVPGARSSVTTVHHTDEARLPERPPGLL